MISKLNELVTMDLATPAIFKITLGQQFKMLSTALFRIAFFLCLYFYVYGFTAPYIGFIYLFIFIILSDLLPAFVLHIQYLLKNRKGILTIDKINRTLTYRSPNTDICYSFESISSIEHVASYGGKTGWYSFGEYRYFKFIFKEKNELIVTCLMINNIQATLETLLGVEAEKQLKVLAWISS